MLLTLPSLWVGLVVDDHVHRNLPLGSSVVPDRMNPLFDLFAFADGDPERMRELMDVGLWPWWTWPEIRAAFFRPVTGLTHWLDYRLWPELPGLMHVHSLLWLGAVVAAAAVLFRRLMGLTVVAGVAALLYATDDGHALPVGFLANRNALTATFFGLLAICMHDRWRRERQRSGAVLASLLLAVSLLSAELGVGAVAYIVAYALILDRTSWRRRLLSLTPYVAVVLAWRIIWSCLGYGVRGTELYVDPLCEPWRYALTLPQRAVGLLLAQLALPPAEVYFGARVMLPSHLAALVWPVASVLVGLMAVAFIRALRRDRMAAFWACGMGLSLLPVCTTAPSDRVMMFVGVGACGLIARFLCAVFARNEGRVRSRLAVAVAVLLVLVHGLIGPVILAVRAAIPCGPKQVAAQVYVNTPLDESVRRQDVVVVNSPIALCGGYLLMRRDADGLPVPRRVRVLSASWSPVEVTRADTTTLIVRPDWGYLGTPADDLCRDKRHPLALGEKVELTGVTVEVTDLTEDGRPAEATFRFAVPLEDASLRWLFWQEGEFVPFTPPDVGQSLHLPAAAPSLRGWLGGAEP
jgi:hypothetical protein